MADTRPLLLLVDDVDLFLELERSYLEGGNYRMEVARSGQEALRKLEELRPQLLLLDLYLPDLNGDVICKKLRAEEDFRTLPVIMITSAARDDEMRRCHKAGADAVLTKPVDRQTLRETVRELLDRDRLPTADDTAPADAAPAKPRRASKPETRLRELQRENRRLQARVAELERENAEFAAQALAAEDYSGTLSNLYVASTRLHATLDRQEVLEIIRDVVINLVGAETFALLSHEEGRPELTFAIGEGVTAADFPPLRGAEGPLGSALADPKVVVHDVDPAAPPDLAAPRVIIPLHLGDRVTGVLAIYRLLEHKRAFTEVDHQLFGLLAEQAATALFSSSLYARAERRQKTFKDVVELLLT